MLGAQPHILLAVCGEPSESSHASEGRVDLFVLRGTPDDIVVAAESLGIGSGSDGKPGQVNILHLGKEFFGFQVCDNFLGQGDLVENTRWFAPGNAGIKLAYSATSLDDNRESGPCLDDSLACTMESRRASIDSSHLEGKTYPILLADTLLKNGVIRPRSTTIGFDKKNWAYPAPKMLSEESE
jgi:hypothetical protein